MKTFSKIALLVSKYLPRGYSRLLYFAAKRDAALRDILLPLRLLPGRHIRADLMESVFIPIFKSGCFTHEIGENLLCIRLLKEGNLVFDIGANIGYTAMLFSERVGQQGKVIAIEPSLRAFNLLKRSIERSGNIISLNIAISDKTCEVLFNEMETLDTSSIEPTSSGKSYTVMATTLDSLSETYGIPNFVKIDVEGHESKIFRGMGKIFAASNPPAVLFEALSIDALNDCLEEIKSVGMQRYKVYRVQSETGAICDDLSVEGTNNYLALPGHRLDEYSHLFGF